MKVLSLLLRNPKPEPVQPEQETASMKVLSLLLRNVFNVADTFAFVEPQ